MMPYKSDVGSRKLAVVYSISIKITLFTVMPANILLAAGTQPKLADFGIARNVETTVTAGVGAHRYMAPEVNATMKYGYLADIYSLTISIWEMFIRKKPYYEMGEGDPNSYFFLEEFIKGRRPIINAAELDEDIEEFIWGWDGDSASRTPIQEFIQFFQFKLDEMTYFDSSYRVQVATLPPKAMDPNNMLLVMRDNEEDDMYILNSTLNKWITLRLKIPYDTSTGGIVCLHGELYVIHGRHGKVLQKMDNNMVWKGLADMHTGRMYITNSCLTLNGFIWVLGGEDYATREDKTRYLDSVERYDPNRNKWFRMPPMKYPRSCAAATVFNGKIIICGGESNNEEILKSVECFNPESGVWTELIAMPIGRRSHTLLSFESQLIAMGGRQAPPRYVSSIMEMNPADENGTWKDLPSMKDTCFGFSSVIFDDIIYVIGGHDVRLKALRKVQMYDGSRWLHGVSLPKDLGFVIALKIPQHLSDTLVVFYKRELLMNV